MNLLEKMGLVERDAGQYPDPYTTAPADDGAIQDESVEVEITAAEDIVNTIYEQNGMSDRSNSIYTVQALIDTLPEEMTTQKKQTTIAGILAVSGKSVQSLLHDAEQRFGVLGAAKDRIIAERTEEISAANADIEKLKGMIEAATIRIRDAEKIMEAAKKDIDNERDGIVDLVSFCKGMEDAE